MDTWKLRVSTEKAETFLNLFNKLRDETEAGEGFLNSELLTPIERNEILNLMDWFEEAYDKRKALELVAEKWDK